MMIVEQMLKNAQTPLLYIADVSGSALFQGDCLEIMPLIPDKSVQLILADLPYGTTACKWDSIINLDLLWEQYKRIIKENGAIALTASQPFTTKLISSNYEMFRYEWIWEKTMATGGLLAKKRPMKAHENICIFSTKNELYNEQRMQGEAYKRVEGKKSGSVIGDKEGGYITVNNGGRSARSVLKIPNPNFGSLPPTQKPLELMKYLIKTYSNENDMVLDNTMGSGTTCVAAKELNRKFIGIEKEPKYYEIACQRCGF